MNPTSLYLAKLLGLYCILLALALAPRKAAALEAFEGFWRSPALLMLAGVLGLAGGLALVVGHNVWSGGALPIAVTLFGWAALAKGFFLLALPPARARTFYRSLGYDRWFYAYLLGLLAIGAWMCAAAFRP